MIRGRAISAAREEPPWVQIKQGRILTLPAQPDDRRRPLVGAFVVTYRRPALLATTLRALSAQTRPLDRIVVLDNDAEAGVPSLSVPAMPSVDVIKQAVNTGSAGGFSAALQMAYAEGLTWAWLLDDDAAPRPETLERLLAAADAVEHNAPPIGIVAPLQVSPRGVFGVSRWKHRAVQVRPREDSTEPLFVDVAYWAGMLVHRRVVESVGLPQEAFFRTFSDYEYCLRARKAGLAVVAVPNSFIDHDPGPPIRVTRFGRASVRFNYPPSRMYYHVRNVAYTTRYVLHSPTAALYHVARQVRAAVGDIVYDDRKGRRVWYRILGLLDGFRGRLGRRREA